MARHEEVTFICDCCEVHIEAAVRELENGQQGWALPAGWVRIEKGGFMVAQPQPAPAISLKGEFCSTECLRKHLLDTTVVNDHAQEG